MTRHQKQNTIHQEYRAWLARLPCAVCSADGVQLAHCGIGGTGLKHGDDDQCLPLCPACHFDHDNTRGKFARPVWADKYLWRFFINEWERVQIAAYRGRFEARNITSGQCPF
jgi:hypothetical protein